jgi:hypothetical protein
MDEYDVCATLTLVQLHVLWWGWMCVLNTRPYVRANLGG